jgi:carbamoyl-phosphate synthase large subunit
VYRVPALASKATGYPIAKIASKLALGYNLDELQNQITKSTSALFEPTLDYVIVKYHVGTLINLKELTELSNEKSVGEVMGIGRSFKRCTKRLNH